MITKKIFYPSLNGLRALSIISVLIQHISMNVDLFCGYKVPYWLKPVTLFLQDGQLGVNIFFVISGFLITTLLLDEENTNSKVSLCNFYVRRILRIFPAYYFLLLIYFILQSFQVVDIGFGSWITAITFTKYFNWQLDSLTGHAWSLSIEEHFYVFWPLVFVYLPKYRKTIAIAIILFVPIVRVFFYFNPVSWINDLTFFTRIDSIATGCLFAQYKDVVVEKVKIHSIKVFTVSSFVVFFTPAIDKIVNKLGLGVISIPFGTTHGTIVNFAISFLMFYFVFVSRGILYKLLNFSGINYIGKLSYSIYLWQQIFIFGASYLFIAYPLNLFLVFIAAVFSYHFIEIPFLKLRRHLLG